ncbi:MAG: tRNA (adenosine(37)-N6)-threonylcarbamoyltransferase complex ATPase subunit type 1 TsaE [Candidatus Xiphinematobacter sp.]|nr:MAG: tRNA (adenosine(37)-N6)-threonylcarbamoyltransferase complex ATPase subunit type 1 TsaE [Candidatus Xiphinematobacter sp.]
MEREFFTLSEIETQMVGEVFAAGLSTSDVLCLEGPMGAGKTQFVKGLARGLGFFGAVTSPTFPLVHEYYEGDRLSLVHFDFFRLDCEKAVEELGFDDYLHQATLAIEWGDKFHELLPSGTHTVLFRILKSGERHIAFSHIF